MNDELKGIKKKVIANFKEPDFRDVFRDNKEGLPIYYDEHNTWWIWKEKENKWEYSDEIAVLLIIQEVYPTLNLCKSKLKQEVIIALKLVFREREIINPDPNWVQFKNKIINLEDNKEIELNNKYFFTNPIQWNISDSEETPIIDKLIASWVEPKYKQMMYEIIAYCLYRDYPIHRIFCFTGSGRNGKSKFLGLINKFLGAENTSTSDLDLLMSRPFESFKLYKKLMCQMGETNYEGLKRTAILKQLSGQDLISFERKGKDGFSDYNYAKLLISTNGIPITHDKSDGFYRRWLIVDFPNNFPEGKDILKTIPDEEYENLARKCMTLLPRLLNDGKFDNEPSISEKKVIYENKSNPLLLYINKFMVKDFNSYTSKTEMYSKFSAWLNENGYRQINYHEFSGLMKFDYDEGRVGDEKTRSWMGLRYLLENESRREVQQVPQVPYDSTPFSLRESPNKNSGTCGTSGTVNIQNSILSSIKMVLNFVPEIKEIELLQKLKEIMTFEYTDFHTSIDKLKHNGDIVELPKGIFKKL